MSGDWIAVLVFFGIGALTLDADGWENALFLLGLILLCGGLVWMASP